MQPITRRLVPLALTLAALGGGALALDARENEVERSTAEFQRHTQQVTQEAMRSAQDMSRRHAEGVRETLEQAQDDAKAVADEVAGAADAALEDAATQPGVPEEAAEQIEDAQKQIDAAFE
jgi:gas vesicle protein